MFISSTMPKVFSSYRREDSAFAGRVFNRLREHFGEGHVFRDVDKLAPGSEFAKIIRDRIAACDALVGIIDADRLIEAVQNGSDAKRSASGNLSPKSPRVPALDEQSRGAAHPRHHRIGNRGDRYCRMHRVSPLFRQTCPSALERQKEARH